MKLLAAAIASLSLMAASSAHADEAKAMSRSILTRDDVRMVAPALDQYTQGRLLGDVWKRPGLAPRDRSIVTLAALIARNQTIEMPYHFNLALDNGVKPSEISEIITHLAFYSGWSNAMSAVAVAKDVFAEAQDRDRSAPTGFSCRFFRSTRPPRRNARRAWAISSARWLRESCSTPPMFCSATCGCVRTSRHAIRLVTIIALIAAGQVARFPSHLNRAMDNGLTQPQAAEVITHLAFYAGWPNAFTALPLAKDVFEKRPK